MLSIARMPLCTRHAIEHFVNYICASFRTHTPTHTSTCTHTHIYTLTTKSEINEWKYM